MTANSTTHDSHSAHERRHASITLEEGGHLVYDRENPDAWLRADGDQSVLEVRA